MLFRELKAVFTTLKDNKVLLRQLDRMIVLKTIDSLNKKLGLSGSVYMPLYMFDTKGLEGKRIVLYGAGAVGKDYYFQIQKQTSMKLVLLVDRQYQE